MENAEINNIIKIVGLQYKKNYDDEESLKSLRYGKIMIMTDQVSRNARDNDIVFRQRDSVRQSFSMPSVDIICLLIQMFQMSYFIYQNTEI